MKKFNEEKIIKILQEAEGDITVREVCRKHQIIEQTFYHWRNQFGSITILRLGKVSFMFSPKLASSGSLDGQLVNMGWNWSCAYANSENVCQSLPEIQNYMC